MRISRAADNGITWASIYISAFACLAFNGALRQLVPWFANSGWARAAAAVLAALMSVAVFVPLRWLRGRFLRVEERRAGRRR